ncbi:uncharacterized protein LOC135830935 [Sycon ciliatum]|uniref:uncharacterized protein LOC135830935 n=1 Tax=Sycon ciliatum TaxID=27933 RepID=UPI0031F6F4B3
METVISSRRVPVLAVHLLLVGFVLVPAPELFVSSQTTEVMLGGCNSSVVVTDGPTQGSILVTPSYSCDPGVQMLTCSIRYILEFLESQQTRLLNVTQCNQGTVLPQNISGLNTRFLYDVFAAGTTSTNTPVTLSGRELVFPGCGELFSCSMKGDNAQNCYTEAERCSGGAPQCSIDYADERGCAVLTVIPAVPSRAPLGSSIRLLCNATPTTPTTITLDWAFQDDANFAQTLPDVSISSQNYRLLSGANYSISVLDIANFTTAHQGMYDCRYGQFQLPDQPGVPFVERVSVTVIADGALSMAGCQSPADGFLSVSPEQLFYQVGDTVTYTCPFMPLFGSAASQSRCLATGLWDPQPPVCQELPHLGIQTVSFVTSAGIRFRCQLARSTGFSQVLSAVILNSTDHAVVQLPVALPQRRRRNIGPVANVGESFFGTAIARNSDSYRCQLNVARMATNGQQQELATYAVTSLPVAVTVRDLSVTASIRPAIILPSNNATLVCDVGDLRAVDSVDVEGDSSPMGTVYAANTTDNIGELGIARVGLFFGATTTASSVLLPLVNVSMDQNVTCSVRWIGLRAAMRQTAALYVAREPEGEVNSVSPVRGLGRSAFNVTFSVLDGGLPLLTSCQLMLSVGTKNVFETLPCPTVGKSVSYVTTSALGENTVYMVRVNLMNGFVTGGITFPSGVSTECRFAECSTAPAGRVCYDQGQICDGINDCARYPYDDESNCGYLVTPVQQITTAENSTAVIPCTFVTSRVSGSLPSANIASSAFAPQWYRPEVEDEFPFSDDGVVGGCPFSLIGPTSQRLANGSYMLTTSISFVPSQCPGNTPVACRALSTTSLGEVYRQLLRVVLLSGDTCPESLIPTPVNGEKLPLQLPDYAESTTATFSCDPGFILLGSDVLTCLNTSLWSDAVPSCEFDQQLQPVPTVPQVVALASANFTMSFTVLRESAFPVDRSSISLYLTDSSNMQRLVNQSRYIVGDGFVTVDDLIVYNITLLNVQVADVGLYSVSLLRRGIEPTVSSALASLQRVIGCDPLVEIEVTNGCAADQDSDQIPDDMDPCPLDRTNTCASDVDCPRDVDSVWALTWTPVAAGAIAQQPCPANSQGIGMATRTCSLSGVWDAANVTQCGSVALLELTALIATTANTPQELPTAEETVSQLSNLSAQALFPQDVTAALSALQILLNQAQGRQTLGVNATSDVFRQGFVETASNLVDSINTRAWTSLESASPDLESQDLLAVIEDFTEFESGLQQGNVSEEVRTNTSSANLFLLFVTLPRPQASQIVLFSAEDNTSETVNLPAEVFERNGATRYAASSFAGIGSLLVPSTRLVPGESLESNSRLLTIVVSTPNGSRQAVRDLGDPITFSLRHFNSTSLRNPTCAFYNFAVVREDGVSLGGWDNDGLERNAEGSDEEALGLTLCSTVHLTSFSVLVSANIVGGANAEALRFISYIGCGISLVCLVIVAFVFIYFKSLHNDHNAIHCNLAISLGLAQLIFLIGIQRTENASVCTGFAVVLHYFFVAAFMWMFVEGLQIYFMLVRVFPTTTKRLLYFYIAAYGVPVVIVAITAGLNIQDYGTETYCWIDVSTNTRWAFHGPIIAIIVVNVGFLLAALRVLFRRAQRKGNDYDAVQASLKGAVVILPLLGISWAMGLLAVSDNTLAFHYLFVIFNSLQGLFIFIMHCVRNPQVKRAIKAWYKRYKAQKRDQQDITTSDKSSGYLKKMRSQVAEQSSTVGTVSTNFPGDTTKSASTTAGQHMQMVDFKSERTDSTAGVIGLMDDPEGDLPAAATSFGKERTMSDRGTSPSAPAPAPRTLQFVGSGLKEDSSDDEDVVPASTPMLAEQQRETPLMSIPASIPSSGSESSLHGAHVQVRVVGGRSSAVEDHEENRASQSYRPTSCSPPPATSETFRSSVTATSASASPPAAALPLLDDVMMSLNSNRAGDSSNTAAGASSSTAAGSGENTADSPSRALPLLDDIMASLNSSSAPATGRQSVSPGDDDDDDRQQWASLTGSGNEGETSLSRRDWRDVTVTKDIRTRVGTKADQGAYNGTAGV